MPEDIAGHQTRFNPFKLGALREQHNARWELETDVAEMTLDVLDSGKYLRRFSSKEHNDEYSYRRDMSVPVDMCRDGVRIRVDNLWRTPPKREVKPSKYRETIEHLITDADGGGRTLDDFMRSALWSYYVTGADIVVQSNGVPKGVEITSKLDVQEFGVWPYFMRFTPLERNDWATDGSNNFTWARYCLGAEPAMDEDQKPSGATEFLTLTGGEWRRHRAVKRPETQTVEVTTTTGVHSLGRPPITKFYFSESQKSGQGGVPLSLLTRPAVVAKVAMNLKSQADADLLAAVPRWWAAGMVGEDLPDVYGPGVLLKLQSPDSKIGVVQGDASHIREKREWLLLYIGEILRLLKFRGGMAEIQASSGSGLKLAIERTDLDNELRATAAHLERTELEMMRQAICLSADVKIAPHEAADVLGYSARYNRDFVLEPVGEMLSNIKTWVTDAGWLSEDLTEITKEMSRQLGNALAREGTPESIAIMEQIDAVELTSGTVPAEPEATAE